MDETLNKRRKPFLQTSSIGECFGFLKNTLFPSNQTTALEITSRGLRLIQFGKTPEKKSLVRRIIQYPFQDQEPEKIKTFLQEHQVGSGRLVTFIPRHLVTQKYLIVPATNPLEIQQMAPFQIPDLTPYSRDEITFDYQVISTDGEGCSKLMAVIVQNKVLEDYFSRLNDFGLRPDAIQLSSAALANWFCATCQEEPPAEADKIYALVYLDEESLDIAYIQGKQLISSRGAELKTSPTSEETFNQVAWELKQGLAIINQELGSREIGKIILAGQSISPELTNFLSEDFSTPVDQVPAPFKDITFAKPFPENKEELENDCSLIRLLGLGLAETASTPILFNLLPLPAKKEKEIYSKKQLYLRNAILGVFVFLLLLFNFSFKIYKEAREIKVLGKKVKSIEPLAKRVELERKTLQLIKEEFNSGPSSLSILEELYKITPETIALSSLDLEIGKVAILRGQAQELSQVFDYMTTVERSPYLQNVKVNYANRRKIGEDETVSFEFYCYLTPSAGEKEVK